MLEKPDIDDQTIVNCLENEYGLSIDTITFLPLGADINTAVYRAVTADRTGYFVKLRHGDFQEASVTAPKFLSEAGLTQVIPPLTTQRGKLWANLDSRRVILYPFVAGVNGFETNISDKQRIALGAALNKLHTLDMPTAITNTIPQETYPSQWRDWVTSLLATIETKTTDDPIATDLIAFLRTKKDQIDDLINRSERLAKIVQSQSEPFVVCHADIHGWNLLIDRNNQLHIVDWDTLLLAPKERDLMFVGCGLGGNGHTLQEEASLFYQGYGQVEINPVAIAYYRYERIIEDIAAYCEQILSTEEGETDRQWGLETLVAQFSPNKVIDVAYQLDQTGNELI